MPRCSRHILTGSTLGIKNAVGYWRTDTRLEFHGDASTLQEKAAESNTVSTLLKKQRLVVTTADKVLTTGGPRRGICVSTRVRPYIRIRVVVAHDMVSLAWLLYIRANVPLGGKLWFDPYKSQLIAGAGNRWVVNLLGGLRLALCAEKYIRNDIRDIWDDRILNRAYEIFGGVPRLIFVEANNILPGELKDRLIKMTTL